jgi:serine/threonine-protein kinase HipA
LIRANCSVPVTELEKFVRWIVFNWLCHNADAHGKNISFLFTEEGKTILAPFYDLVCTRNYPQLYRNLAMEIGGEASPGAVEEKHLKKLSEDIQMPFSFIKEVAVESAAKLIENLEAQKEVFIERFGESPILQRVPGIVEKRCNRALKFLKKT